MIENGHSIGFPGLEDGIVMMLEIINLCDGMQPKDSSFNRASIGSVDFSSFLIQP